MRAWRGPTRSRGRVCLGTVALLGAWLAAPPLRAQVEPPPAPPSPPPPPPASDLEGISLEALLDTVVWIASRRDERVSAAPGSITVYTEEDLRALGYYTIYDLANFTPGWSGSIVFGEKVLETRGQKAGSFNNNKHLVYVDGIPVAHARNYRAPVDEELPLFFARSVEFLRGPASALYGTSAFFGVVNVVPGDLEHEGSDFGLRLSAGTRDVERRVGAQALVNDAAGSFRLALGYYEKNASRTPLPPPPGAATDPGSLFWDDQKSVFLNPTYTLRISPLRGLGIGVIYMRKSGGLGESWREGGSHRLNDLTWETAIPYVKYRRTLSERLAVDAYLLYNTGRETGLWSNFAGKPLTAEDGAPLYGYDTQVDDIQGETQLSLSLGERTSVTAGVNVDTRRQRGSSRSYSYGVTADPGAPFVLNQSLEQPSDRYTIYSVFAQLQHRLPVLAGLTLTLGAREDVGVSSHSTYQQLSPRAGLVQAITEAAQPEGVLRHRPARPRHQGGWPQPGIPANAAAEGHPRRRHPAGPGRRGDPELRAGAGVQQSARLGLAHRLSQPHHAGPGRGGRDDRRSGGEHLPQLRRWTSPPSASRRSCNWPWGATCACSPTTPGRGPAAGGWWSSSWCRPMWRTCRCRS